MRRVRADTSGADFLNIADGDMAIGCVVAILVGAVLLAFPVILLAALFIVEWLLVLLLLPIVVLIRTAFGVPWRVVARSRDADGRRWRYYGQATGWRAASDLISKVKDEIIRYGEPRSLGAVKPDRQDQEPDKSATR